MADSLGTLSLNIRANITSASNNIKKLETNISKLKTTLGGLDPAANSVNNLAISVKNLAIAMSLLKGNKITAATFGSLSKGLEKVGNIDPNKINRSAQAMQRLSSSVGAMGRRSGGFSLINTNARTAFQTINSGAGTATLSLKNLAQVMSRLYIVFMSFRSIGRWIGSAVEYASDLVETQNVVRNAFGVQGEKTFQNSDLMQNSINQWGMSRLTASQWASRYQAMGTALGISQKDMAPNAIEMTKLAGDIASFYNVEVAEAAEDLQAIFTGQTRPLTIILAA